LNAAAEANSVDKPLIVIVEDDERSRRLMKDVLEHHGYVVLDTDNGESGLDLVRAHHPALVLMDIQLPGMSGLEALQAIRADASIAGTKVMAVTASVMDGDRDRIRVAGFDAFVPKPLSLPLFLQEVERLTAAC
jgi:two-component system cell cycle response regulator DivK